MVTVESSPQVTHKPLTKEGEEIVGRFVEKCRDYYRQNIDPIMQKHAELQKTIAEADRNIAQARAIKAESQQRLIEIGKEQQVILTKMFQSIFNSKNRLPVEVIDVLFNKYLADGSLTVEETDEGKSYARVNSMRAITRYITDDNSVTMCDFRPFKGEIYDVPTLAEYLKTSRITAIAFNDGISGDAKKSLAEAVAARNGGLKIRYYP